MRVILNFAQLRSIMSLLHLDSIFNGHSNVLYSYRIYTNIYVSLYTPQFLNTVFSETLQFYIITLSILSFTDFVLYRFLDWTFEIYDYNFHYNFSNDHLDKHVLVNVRVSMGYIVIDTQWDRLIFVPRHYHNRILSLT